MSEFDEKLNALLSDPGSMARIMELAQSLSGGQGGGTGGTPPGAAFPGGSAAPPGGSPGGQGAPSGSFPGGMPGGTGGSPGGTGPGFPGAAPPGGGPSLSSLLGGMDPALLARLLPLAQELGGAQTSQAAALLFALQPYLKPERQANVPRALQLARLLRLGKRFLRDREGGALV